MIRFIDRHEDCLISDSVVTFGYPFEYMRKIGLFCIYKRNYHTLFVLISPIAEEVFFAINTTSQTRLVSS